jgi:threonine dehydrogenase-like Zn-dependent dehydrogenase
MRQVVLLEPGRFASREVEAPRRAPDQALVRVRRIGVCGTDLHAYAGRQPFFTYPRVLGHELSVTVEEVPDGDTRVRAGDLCAVRPFLNDPASRASLRGRPNCCESLKVLGVHVDGGMGDLLAIETRFLHPVPDLDEEAAALIEPLSIGCHAVGRGRPTPDDRTLVIGAGPIGLATAQFAALAGAPLTIVDL